MGYSGADHKPSSTVNKKECYREQHGSMMSFFVWKGWAVIKVIVNTSSTLASPSLRNACREGGWEQETGRRC